MPHVTRALLRKRAEAFCEFLGSSEMGFGWTCYGRADLADELTLSDRSQEGSFVQPLEVSPSR